MWNETLQWVSENSGLVAASSITLLAVLIFAGWMLYDRRASIKAYWEHRRTIRIQRGLVMGRKKSTERKAYVKGVFSDVVTNGLEEAWFAGKITREEVNDLYRAIGKTHNMPDLLPHMTPAALKAAIKGRRARGGGVTAGPAQEHPADGGRPATADAAAPAAPPALPDPANGSNVVQAAKRFGAKALAKIKKAS